MNNALCPSCARPVLLASLLNRRNGRWVVLPLDEAEDPETEANFVLTGAEHEAVDIMGNVAGTFPVAVETELLTGSQYRTHPPSHYLEAHR